MGTHRISEDVEKRLFEWVKAHKEGQSQWSYTFDDAIDDLLKEAGF